MAQAIAVFVVAAILGILSTVVLTLNILSIVNDGANFWNIFWVALIGSSILTTSKIRK